MFLRSLLLYFFQVVSKNTLQVVTQVIFLHDILHVCVWMCMCMDVCIHVCVWMCESMYVCVWMCVSMYVYGCVYPCMCLDVCIHVCVWMCVSMYVYGCVSKPHKLCMQLPKPKLCSCMHRESLRQGAQSHRRYTHKLSLRLALLCEPPKIPLSV
jgi:hypothetical protein